jgi:capsular exopolysaccharide synthesis family protein
MSRIHEALRRAEQERSAVQSAQRIEEATERKAATGLIEAAGPSHVVSTPPVVQPAIVPESKADSLPDVLQFDEIWAKCTRPKWRANSNLLVFGDTSPSNLGTEPFRTLRSRLYRIRDSQPLQSILISSSIPAEGKTLVATNLAYALARQQGSRVLLIDADIRSPRTHILLGAPATPGLADYLQNGRTEFEVIQRGFDVALCFIPAGNHVTHPAELISSQRLKNFLERVKPAFDWIIIDSPPALPVADATVLGAMCDGVLFVVRANSTPSETAQKACKELAGTNVLGVVLNTVDATSEYGSYYSGGQYGVQKGR